MTRVYLAALALTLLSACATPHVVQAVKTSDTALDCAQLDAEMRDAERFRADAQKEKGMTGTNVVAALFFWPAVVGTYVNAGEAITAADTRKANLMGIYNQKKCGEQPLQTSNGGALESGSQRKLSEIKAMLDQNIISQDEYDQKRKKILAEL